MDAEEYWYNRLLTALDDHKDDYDQKFLEMWHQNIEKGLPPKNAYVAVVMSIIQPKLVEHGIPMVAFTRSLSATVRKPTIEEMITWIENAHSASIPAATAGWPAIQAAAKMPWLRKTF
jgi:hypothetical protein